jgi:hypothetical protein
MILLLFVAVVVIVALAARSRSGTRPDDRLAAVLRRAVSTGTITDEQADAMLRAEAASAAAPSTAPGEAPTRMPPVLEVLGYLGGILAMVGASTLVARFWDDLATWSRVAILGAVAVAFTVAGLVIRDEEEPVLWRLRGFLLMLATGGVAGFTGLLLVDALDVTGPEVGVAVGGAAAVHAGFLWWRQDRPAQHATCLGGLIAALASGLVWAGAGPGTVGLALWGLGVLWLVASYRQLLPPALVGVTLGAALPLVGAAVVSGDTQRPGVLLGLATAAALVAAGVRLEEFLVTGIGVVGTFIYLPVAVNVFFGGTIGVPALMFASGLVLLALTVLLVRRRGGGGSWPGAPRLGH